MTEPPGFLIIERILRDREGVWRQIYDDSALRSLTGKLLGTAALALATYGAVMGASNGVLQAVASAVKLPALFMVTLAICLPALYLFNLVFGSRLSLRQALSLVSIAINVMAMLALAFAPIALFFLVTAPSYNFYKLLNVAILALTGLVGVTFLVSGMKGLNSIAHARAHPAQPHASLDSVSSQSDTVDDPAMPDTSASDTGVSSYYNPAARPPSAVNMKLLYVWAIVFGFVGTQLAWTLRPFLGSPDEEFAVVRSIDGNFYVDIMRTISTLFG